MTDTARSEAPETVQVTVDGTVVEARPGELVIEVAERAGVFIPRFCYHPRMEPVGMCRMCLVEVSGPRGFGLQPACFVRVAPDQEIRTASEKARKAQEGVLEFLLVNHPLDCPVCDKGGECPLQDQALSHGPGESRFVEEKRHWEKPIRLGPLIDLDRERCIQCARCTRFAEEVAGEALIDFAFRGDHIEVATFPERPFSSHFSGNTVQICPVGALTAVPYRFKSRPWDLEQVETTCSFCSVGCRVVAQSSAGRLVRYLGVDSDPVNQSWLCDRGRYGFEAAHAPSRLGQPLVRREGELVPARWAEALREVTAGVRQAQSRQGGEGIAVLGGARLTNEDAYAWAKLAKGVWRTDSVDAQLGDGLPAEAVLGLPRATIEETLAARAVVLLAPDLREELPVLFLRLRAAAAHDGLALLECSPVPTALTPLARAHCAYLPGEAPRVVAALTGAEDGEGLAALDPAALASGRALLAEACQGAGSPEAPGSGVVVVLGRPSVAEDAAQVVAAAAALRAALPGVRFLSALRRGNVHGALDLGLAPGVLPGRVGLEAGREAFGEAWGGLPEQRGRDARAILEAAAAGELSMLVLLGADPIADFPDAELAREALSRVDLLVALGTHRDASNELAHVVLPLAGADERTGTTTNLEGRVSRVAQKIVSPGVAWPAWSVAEALAQGLGADLGFENLESVTAEIERLAPAYRGVTVDLLGRPAYRDGVVVPLPGTPVSLGPTRRPPRPLDPIATPGILSAEEQGAPLAVGAGVPLGGPAEADGRGAPGAAGEGAPGAAGVGRASGARPELLALGEVEPAPTPRIDAYSLRLVLRRSLYDGGTLVAASPSLAPLAPEPELSVHPSVLEQLGVAAGEAVRVRSARGELEVKAVVDAGLPRQVAALGAGLGTAGGAGLVEAGAPVTDVRLETIR